MEVGRIFHYKLPENFKYFIQKVCHKGGIIGSKGAIVMLLLDSDAKYHVGIIFSV